MSDKTNNCTKSDKKQSQSSNVKNTLNDVIKKLDKISNLYCYYK